MEYWAIAASITVQQAQLVTTTNAEWMYRFTRFRRLAPKTTPTAPVVSICKQLLPYQQQYRFFIMEYWWINCFNNCSNGTAYTVTTNASGCTSLQGSGVSSKQLLLLGKCCKQL
jgi:hypothetical protein